MKTSRVLTSTLAAVLLIGAPAGLALAQTAEPDPMPEASEPDPMPEVSESDPMPEASEPDPMPEEEVSDTQLDRFVSAFRSIQTIEEATQAELVAAVEAEGLTVDEYQAIAAAQQAPETAAQVSPEQAEQFAAASEQVSTIRADARAEMEAAIVAESLTIDEFEQILALAQQDPEVQAAINERLAQ